MNHVLTERETYLVAPTANENSVLNEILIGMQKDQKELPSKLFYDDCGSYLFDEITRLEEYYPTRTEAAIMDSYADEIVNWIGSHAVLVEYGSGSSTKTRILLDHLPEMAAYVPVDISREHLFKTAEVLQVEYPDLTIAPVWADYTKVFSNPVVTPTNYHHVAYFPGSTIGNFYPHQAIKFLRNIAELVGVGGGLLVGVDLQKDHNVLNRAYNDSQGVTAAFNLNMLTHINREFGADFDVDKYHHRAFYNCQEGRIEMRLVSDRAQSVHVAGKRLEIEKGENILTEVSYKYTLSGFAELAASAGFEVGAVWTDPKKYFSVQYLVAV